MHALPVCATVHEPRPTVAAKRKTPVPVSSSFFKFPEAVNYPLQVHEVRKFRVNDLYDGGKLNERFCSADCVYKWKTATSPPSESEWESREPDCPSQASLPSYSQESTLQLGQPTHFDTPPPPPPVVDLTATSETCSASSRCSTSSSGVDAFGIPLDVCHFRQENCRHDVWDVGHRLETPYMKSSGTDMKPFTHVCLLCAQQLMCKAYAAPNAWEGALYRWTNTSNARSHMLTSHKEHPLGIAEMNMKLKSSSQQLDDAMGRAYERENKRAITTTISDRAPKTRGTLQKLWTPTQRELGVFIAHWLISSSLPYNTVASEDFKLLVQRLTGDPNATILSATTFRDLLEAVFAKFCKMTSTLLHNEFTAAHGPFLNLHHDGWSTGNGKVKTPQRTWYEDRAKG